MKSLRQLYHSKRATATSAVALLMLLAIAAILVDLGHMFVVRRQIQEAAEAGAEAGARALAYGTTLNFQMAISTATATVRAKPVDGVLLRDFNTDGQSPGGSGGLLGPQLDQGHGPGHSQWLHRSAELCPLCERGSGGQGEYCQDDVGGAGHPMALTAYFSSFMGFSHVEVATFAVAVRPGGPHVYGAGVNETTLVK